MVKPLDEIPRGTIAAGRAPGRMTAVDLARALATLGMMVVNVESIIADNTIGPDWLIQLIEATEGRFAPIFVVLAGLGVTLMTRGFQLCGDRYGLNRTRHVLFKRAAFLFAAGLCLRLDWPADILHCYGVYLMIGALMLTASTRQLLGTAALVYAVSVSIGLLGDLYQQWDWSMVTDPELFSPKGLIRYLLFVGYYPAFPWLSFFLFGMWLGRNDMAHPRFKILTLAAGTLLVAAGEVLPRVLKTTIVELAYSTKTFNLIYLASTDAFPPMPLFGISGIGAALTVIGMCLVLVHRWPASPALSALIVTGRMTLTLYVAHIVIGIDALALAGMGENQPFMIAVLWGLAFFGLSVLFAVLWDRRFGRGPLERIMRSISEIPIPVPFQRIVPVSRR